MIYRFLLFLLVFASLCSRSFAASLESCIDSVLDSSYLAKTSTIAVKITDAKTNKVLYSKNSSLLLHPASLLKVSTSAMVMDTLGKKYELKTSLYEKNDTLYLKLSGNPLFTRCDLANLFNNIDAKKYKVIVIDNTIIDGKYLGTGWMWDNFIAKEVPKFNAFNIDGNLATVYIKPNKKSNNVQIISDYPLPIMNHLVLGKKNDITIEHKPWVNPDSPEAIYMSGEVEHKVKRKIPVRCPMKYFLRRLCQVVPSFKGQIVYGKVPLGAKLVSENKTPLIEVMKDLNKNSNNMSAETMFKIAAAKHYRRQGTTEDAIKLFENFYQGEGSDIVSIVDASGLSHNNLMSVDFIHKVLTRYKNDKFFLSTLAEPYHKGTLKRRLKGYKIKGKTGTLCGVSGICGYLESKSGKDYIFTILIQNFAGRAKKAKRLEDRILSQLNWF